MPPAPPLPVRLHETETQYGNGVLVLSIPKASEGRQGSLVFFQLEAAEPTRGVWIGRPAGNPQAA
jgi:hypothetical protein